MAGPGRWCDRVPPATAIVDCGGERHRVTWRRGKIVLEDHDLDAERTLVLLGGAPCACLTVLDLWRNLFSWAMSAEMFRQMDARLGPGSNLLAPGDLREIHELALLLTWQRRWRLSAYFSDHERLLLEQVRKRALPPLKEHVARWRQRAGSRLLSTVDVKVARTADSCRLDGSLDRVRATATASLDVWWVIRVWTQGVVTVDDAFVLEVVDAGSGADDIGVRAAMWKERTAGSGRYEPVARYARLRRDDSGAWQLSWEETRAAPSPAPLPSLEDLLDGRVPPAGDAGRRQRRS